MKEKNKTKDRIESLRDQDLRKYTARLFLAIEDRIKHRNSPFREILWMENKIIFSGREACARYDAMLVGGQFFDIVPCEHKIIQELILHLLEQAHINVPGHHESGPVLEDLMTFMRYLVYKHLKLKTEYLFNWFDRVKLYKLQ